MGFIQDVLLKFGITGEAKVSKGIDSVTKSQKKLADETARKGKLDTAGAKTQDKANAALADYGEIASRIDPTLGALFMSAEKLFKIGGDMAQLPLGDMLGKGTSKLKEFGGAFKFLGAAGLAAGAVAILVSQIQMLNAEMAAYIKLQDDARKQAEGLATTQRVLADAFRAAANARIGMPIVGEEEGRAGGARAERLGEQLRMDPRVIADLLGKIQGLGISPEVEKQLLAIVKAGRGIGFVQDQGEASRRATIQSAIERNQILTGPRGMEQLFGTTRGTAAGARPGGVEATLNAREFVEKFLGVKGPELDRLMEMFAFAGGEMPVTRRAVTWSNITGAIGDPIVDTIARILGERMGQPIGPTELTMFGPSGGKMGITREELAELFQLMLGLIQEIRQDKAREREAPTPAPVQNYNPTYNFNHPITPDSQTTDRDDTEGSP